MKKTLAIETSCDDTSLAIVCYDEGGFRVEKIKAYSQIADHQQYGGVVPEIAFRLHSEQILALLHEFLPDMETIDSISVTTHPGLAGSLLVGKTVANILSQHFQKPLIPVNHIYGHIFSLLLDRNEQQLPFPWVILTASGGHNEIYLVEQSGALRLEDLTITKLGKTLDDAAGECFDKVARMLGGPYPGGARIEQQAKLGKKNDAIVFKKIFLQDHNNPYDFSFSGMKSQVYTLIQKLEKQGVRIEGQVLYDIAYAFQEAVVEVLAKKLLHAVEQFGAKTIGITGGVSSNDRVLEIANQMLQEASQEKPQNTKEHGERLQGREVLRPMKKLYSTDNGAMVGVIGLLS